MPEEGINNMFVIRCLRIKDKSKPLASKCKNHVDPNNEILCKECAAIARCEPIYVMMHHSVSQKFSIKYTNQMFVRIDLSNPSGKPESRNNREKKLRVNKDALIKSFNSMHLKKLKEYHDKLGLKSWGKLKDDGKSNYALRYTVIREIINKFIQYSNRN